jgi:hypothetical protein
MAKATTKVSAARADKSFQASLTKMVRDCVLDIGQEMPEWPFKSVTPAEWESLPYRVRYNISTMLSQYIKESRT